MLLAAPSLNIALKHVLSAKECSVFSTVRLRYVRLAFVVAAILAFVAAVVSVRAALPAFAAGGESYKVTLCHASPPDQARKFERVTVAAAGAFNGHLKHADDIIPPFQFQGQTYSLNWDARGMEIFRNGCVVPMPSPSPTPTPNPCAAVSLISITGVLSADRTQISWFVHNGSDMLIGGTFISNGVSGVGAVPAHGNSVAIVRPAVSGLNVGVLDFTDDKTPCEANGQVDNTVSTPPPATPPPATNPPVVNPPTAPAKPVAKKAVPVVNPPSVPVAAPATGGGGCAGGSCG